MDTRKKQAEMVQWGNKTVKAMLPNGIILKTRSVGASTSYIDLVELGKLDIKSVKNDNR